MEKNTQERNEKMVLTAADFALYLGLEVEIQNPQKERAILGAVGLKNPDRAIVRFPSKGDEREWSYADLDEIKLILRPLSSMSEQEELLLRTVRILDLNGAKTKWYETPNSIRCLLAMGFDIFGWIEKGLAIEKK